MFALDISRGVGPGFETLVRLALDPNQNSACSVSNFFVFSILFGSGADCLIRSRVSLSTGLLWG